MIGRIALNKQTIYLKQVLGLIQVLFLGSATQPISKTYTYSQYSQSDRNQTQRIVTSRDSYLLLNYFVDKYIRVVLPRLPTGGLLATTHDSWILASSASSIVKVNTIRSCTWIRFLPFFRIAFKATMI